MRAKKGKNSFILFLKCPSITNWHIIDICQIMDDWIRIVRVNYNIIANIDFFLFCWKCWMFYEDCRSGICLDDVDCGFDWNAPHKGFLNVHEGDYGIILCLFDLWWNFFMVIWVPWWKVLSGENTQSLKISVLKRLEWWIVS